MLRRFFKSRESDHDTSHTDLTTDYKIAMRRNAGSIAVITTGAGAKLGGITSTSFNSLSVSPPAIFFSLAQTANAYDLFFEAGVFTVNILGQGQEDIAALFADQKRRERRFKDTQWSRRRGGAPVLEGGIAAAIECRLHSHQPVFTHTIIVGEVEHVHLGATRPLVYLNGGYVDYSDND